MRVSDPTFGERGVWCDFREPSLERRPMTGRWFALLGCASVLAACAAAPASSPPPAATRAARTPPQVASFTADAHALTLKTTIGTLSIIAVNDHVLRVRGASGDLGTDFSWAVVPGANTPKGSLTVKDEGGVLAASTPDVHVRVQKDPLRIVFLDP